MQLGIRLHDMAKLPFEERLKEARKQGFSCIHLALSKISDLPAGNESLTPGYASWLKKTLDRYDMDVAVLGCYLNLANPDPVKLASFQQRYTAHLRFASTLGCDLVGTKTGAPNLEYKYEPACHTQEALDTFVEGLRPVVRDQLVDEVTFNEALAYIEKGANMQFQFSAVGSFLTVKDGPIGFVNDQVPGYSTNWSDSQSDEPTYVGPDNEYADWFMAVMPTEPVVAATFNKELVEREGELFGEDSLWSNVISVMGPGLNNHRAVYCSRNHEYYSEDAMLTNIMGLAVSIGGSHKGMMMEPKHFASNHQEANRSGVCTFNTEQAIREIELRGFQGALESNIARGVMTAFNRIGTVYAGAHYGLLTQILRNEWGFNGFMITDAINGPEYMNWRDVTFAGGGGCLTENAFETSVIGQPSSAENQKLIKADTAFQQAVKQNIKYTLYAIAGSNAMNGITSDTTIVRVYPWWEKALYAANAVSGILALCSFAWYAVSVMKKKEQ